MARVAEESKVAIEAEEYVNSFTASMMEATYTWANGAKFSEVIERISFEVVLKILRFV